MSTINLDSEESTLDLWQVIESIKDKMRCLLTNGSQDGQHHISPENFGRFSKHEKDFILQRLRGFLFHGVDGAPSYRLVWNEDQQDFSVQLATT